MTTDPRPARSRRVDILVALGIVLPSVVALAVGVIGEEDDPLAPAHPPRTAPLTAATVVCPAALDDGGPVRVTRAPDVAGGELTVLTAPRDGASLADAGAVRVPAESSVVVPRSEQATALAGTGEAAPGIVAGRTGGLALPECRTPSYDEWLVGLGASARYSSTIELVNPDEGDAVVDIELFGAAGPVEAPALRGIQVPARGVRRIDLSQEAPQRSVTAGHLVVTRGRVTAAVRTTRDPLGRSRVATEFLPAQAAPVTENLVLGLTERVGGAVLMLANPGESEARARIRLVTEDAVFAPAGAEDVAVAPQSLATVDLAAILRESAEGAEGIVGVLVESTAPVAASVRGLVRGDLVLLAPAPGLRGPTAAVLPAGPKTLLLGGAVRTGVVHVRSYDARGRDLGEERVEVGADRSARLDLPAAAVAITVEARNTPVSGAVVVPVAGRSPGLATLRLRPAEVQARIPDVRPQ